MIDRQESYSRETAQPLSFPTARQSPVRLPRIEMRIWLYLSSRINQIVTGEELLEYAWDGKDRHGRKLDWNYPDKTVRNQHHHLVVGAIEHIRGRVHSDGQYVIDTTYEKADGLEGYRVRETTDEDVVKLMEQGYLGAYNRRMAMLAEREAIAAQSRRPALESGQDSSRAPAQSSEERSDDHHLFSDSSGSVLPSSSLEEACTEPEQSIGPVQNGHFDRSALPEMVKPLESDHGREPLSAAGDGDDAVVGQLGQVLPQRLFRDT